MNRSFIHQFEDEHVQIVFFFQQTVYVIEKTSVFILPYSHSIAGNNKAYLLFEFPFLYIHRLKVFTTLNLDKDLHYTSACFPAYGACF